MATSYLDELGGRYAGVAATKDAAEHVNASNPKESQAARNAIESVVRDPAKMGPLAVTWPIDYSDPATALNWIGVAQKYYSDVVAGYFKGNKPGIFDQLRGLGDNLAKKVGLVKPVKTGETKHDERVAAHEKASKLEVLAQEVHDGKKDPTELSAVAEKHVGETLDQIMNNTTNPDAKYVTKDFLKLVKGALMYCLKTDPRVVGALYTSARQYANEKFDKMFKDANDKIGYIVTNLSKLAEKEPVEAAGLTLALAKA